MKDEPVFLYYRNDPYPSCDRLLPGDRFPRRVLSRLKTLGRTPMRGQQKVFENLRRGLARLEKNVLCNQERAFRKNEATPVGFLGKRTWISRVSALPNPTVLGPAIIDHPLEYPDLLDACRAKAYLAPSEWYAEILREYWPADKIRVWPVGIDTERWRPAAGEVMTHEFLVYDKISDRGFSGEYRGVLRVLEAQGCTYRTLTYGGYSEGQYHQLLRTCKAVLFLSVTETQGIAYLEAMSMNRPILAWNRGYHDYGESHGANATLRGLGKREASSCPYLDELSGMAFDCFDRFPACLTRFRERSNAGLYSPRETVRQRLTLEKSAKRYLDLLSE